MLPRQHSRNSSWQKYIVVIINYITIFTTTIVIDATAAAATTLSPPLHKAFTITYMQQIMLQQLHGYSLWYM